MKIPTVQIPTLQTARLTLRPFGPDDAEQVQALAGDYEVAKTTATVPHPYDDGVAEEWISGHYESWRQGTNGTWAITQNMDGNLIGCINIELALQHESGELGYWIGRPYWGQGYGTEAAKAIVDYSFDTLQLHHIFARHMHENPASGRIMQKIGMTFEGVNRESKLRFGKRLSISVYSILRHEWVPLESAVAKDERVPV